MDKIRNDDIRNVLGVRQLSQGNRLRWFGHVERRNAEYVGKAAASLEIEGKRKRGRPQTTWESKVKDDLKRINAGREDALGRKAWRNVTRTWRTPGLLGQRLRHK